MFYLILGETENKVSLDGRGVWGRTDTSVCMAESLCHSPETITLLISYIPMQNKKFKKGTYYKKRKMQPVTLSVVRHSSNGFKNRWGVFNLESVKYSAIYCL